jgi:16S rRNA (adenine1518-N6/adenine1519-N6)-dimethyltransferase
MPKVESSILNIAMHKTPPVGLANEKLFYRIVRAAFSKRRKMLRNSLGTIENDGYAVKEALAAANIDETRRAESLSLNDFARLTDAIIEETGK